MHELSIALNLLDAAAGEAALRGVDRVLTIHLRLGPLSGVVKDALLSAFEIAREGSRFAETRLAIEEVAVLVDCPTCGGARPIYSVQELRCRECGTPADRLIGGRELDIVALEVP